ncbi:efflux RND transporter periplasmic adaptor subunit [Mucilaginibacter aquariorum]|uniref:Efflux RND transporter periplasmic adaptor subunit n=1 Tax=Mucilaginibacter aquariorum TaxID=2967225 RepID=A0ABT1T8X7_9SPHI|nr:efflux RND transporter periplasmic adaptor subunit [Mucilaginibacter aquariorum]MCQ6961065.1 efflux RND transporter periplasmic adaptor subunit [Mucilaginibacter aquariorum]
MAKSVIYMLIAFVFIAACRNDKAQKRRPVTDSMADMPGMSSHGADTDTLIRSVLAPVNQVVLSNAQTIRPETKNIVQTIHAPGYFALDERKNNRVAVRASGRIEKLYVKLNYQYVRKGEKILDLYSPELNTYQEEYLHHLETKSDSILIEGTRIKLKLLGLSEGQINRIRASRRPEPSVAVYSPYDGFIFYDFDRQNVNMAPGSASTAGEMGGMGGGNGGAQPPGTNLSSIRIREGGYVTKGQTLFFINDCRSLYGILAFDANDGTKIKLNSALDITTPLLPQQRIEAKINFIEPAFAERQKFIQARAYVNNESLRLKVNSVISAELKATGMYLVVPSSSILSLGNRKFVWVKKGTGKNGYNVLNAKEVKAGAEMNGVTQIISGLAETDEIVKDAGYLLDSESLIKPGE